MTEAYKRTDVVFLKSGGPAMTVKKVIPVRDPKLADRGDLLECAWFEGKKHREKLFFSDLVTRSDPKAPPARVPMPNETERDHA